MDPVILPTFKFKLEFALMHWHQWYTSSYRVHCMQHGAWSDMPDHDSASYDPQEGFAQLQLLHMCTIDAGIYVYH